MATARGAVLGVLAHLSCGLQANPESPPAVTLEVGTGFEQTLAPGQAHAYRIEPSPGHRRVLLRQLDVDVVLELSGPDGFEPLEFNAPTDRWGVERVLLPAGGPYRLVVHAPGSAAPPGRYEIRLDRLPADTPEARMRLEAEAAMSEAARHYFDDTAESRRLAMTRYQQALNLWRTLGQPDQEALTLYSVATLHRLLDETQPALDLYLQALALARELEDGYLEAACLNGLGLAQWSLGRIAEAQASFRLANAVRLRLGDRYGQAAVANNLCLMSLVQGDLDAGVKCYEESLALLTESGDRETEAAAMINLGRAYKILGRPEPALQHYHRALALEIAQGRRMKQGQTLNNLGVLHFELGEPREALDLYLQALEIFRELGARRWEARALNNIGDVYRSLGEFRRALAFMEQALAYRREMQDPAGQASSLRGVGEVRLMLNEPDQAIGLFAAALQLENAIGNRRGQGIALSLLGAGHLQGGRPVEALDYLQQARTVLEVVGDLAQQAVARHRTGEALMRVGRAEEALADFRTARELFGAIRDPTGEAETLYAMARLALASGGTRQALERVGSAVEIIESLRDRVVNPDLRASFLGVRRGIYELEIDILLELHRDDASAGYGQAALEASERARARSLLDLLKEVGADFRRDLPPAVAERLRSARRLVQAKAERQRSLLAERRDDEQTQAAELELYAALTELDRVEAEIRQTSPRHAALTQPRALSAREIQALLDGETLLLEYSLGARRSFLWAVTPDSTTAFELPGRAQIDAAAVAAHRELSTPGLEGRAAAALSDLLLGPVEDRLDGQRLVVVADGALHYLPFGAMPIPGASGASEEPWLLARHEVVHLPSASALSVLRRQALERTRAPKWVAVVADPVFDGTDPRVNNALPVAQAPSIATSRSDRPELYRLRASRREAEAIAALGPADEVLLVLDFDASREFVLGERLNQYRIIHLATHGLIDAATPALTGLALSQVGPDGSVREGFLGLNDIYNLDLKADLVVLSACRTALGKEIRGEGMVGLTRGFMHAGASRVIASLWPVPERATAELMVHFYREMAQRGSSPAAALQSAQRAILTQRRWRHPHYWGGFVLLGDWRDN